MKNIALDVSSERRTGASARRIGAMFSIGFGSTLVIGLALSVNGQGPNRMPVYKVVKEGVTATEGTSLASKLGVTAKSFVSEKGGSVAYVDNTSYLRLPKDVSTEKLAKSESYHRAVEATHNKDASRSITPTLFNLKTVEGQHVVDEKVALSRAAEALKETGLTPQYGQAFVGHHQLTLFSKDGEKKVAAEGAALDTEVNYRFTDPHGYPIFGPGAQTQITYDSSEHVNRVYYATRQLEADGTVEIISQSEAEEEISHLLPPATKIKTRLIYYAPPISNGADSTRVAELIPWYAYYGTRTVTNPRTGVTTELKTKIGFIPATHDPRFVPNVKLTASGRTEVQASVAVEGGRAPYRFVWGGSNSSVGEINTSSVHYTPQFRAERSLQRAANFRVQRDERVSVTVIDSNGVAVSVSQILPVEATPIYPENNVAGGRNSSTPTFGSENPGTPLHWVPAQQAWNQEMGTPGGGATLSYNWGGDDAWPGDFIRPTPAGTLVSTPWVNGDADFANWGIDTADIVLDNADGWPDGTSLMFPGALDTDYNTSNGGSVSSPVSSPDVQIGSQGYTVGYNGSWGPVGPNDTLEWLLLDDCDMLDALDGSSLNVAQRWGPAFGGLHVLTGFASEGYGDGAFEGGVADRVLGVNGQSAQTIVQSWFNSASATGAGTAAAMGPAIEIEPGIFICDYEDYYWGKGLVGPTLVPSSYPSSTVAYWYVTSTSSLQYLF